MESVPEKIAHHLWLFWPAYIGLIAHVQIMRRLGQMSDLKPVRSWQSWIFAAFVSVLFAAFTLVIPGALTIGLGVGLAEFWASYLQEPVSWETLAPQFFVIGYALSIAEIMLPQPKAPKPLESTTAADSFRDPGDFADG